MMMNVKIVKMTSGEELIGEFDEKTKQITVYYKSGNVFRISMQQIN